MRPAEIVGYRLKRFRDGAGMTQSELGQALGDYLGKGDDKQKPRTWSAQAVSAAEKGERDFTAEEIFALALIFQAAPGAFFVPPLDEKQIDFERRQVPAEANIYMETAAADELLATVDRLRGGLDQLTDVVVRMGSDVVIQTVTPETGEDG